MRSDSTGMFDKLVATGLFLILPTTTIRSMDQVVGESLGSWAGGTAVIGLLGLGALLLAALGIYGVISYSVGQRTHEVGVRLALGAHSGHILMLVMKESLRLAALDPFTFVVTPLLPLAIASAASSIPALRATRVDPMTALRWE